MNNITAFNDKALKKASEFIDNNHLVTQIFELRKKFKKEHPATEINMEDFVRLYFSDFCHQFLTFEISGMLECGHKKTEIKKILKNIMNDCIEKSMCMATQECTCDHG